MNVPFAQTGSSTPIWKNGTPTARRRRQPSEQLDDAEQRDDERDEVDRSASRRKLEREGDEDLPEPQRDPPPPRQGRELLFVEPAREEVVRVARIVREEPLEILARQITRIGVKPLAGAVGRGGRPWGNSEC